jgi:hypothetical protein
MPAELITGRNATPGAIPGPGHKPNEPTQSLVSLQPLVATLNLDVAQDRALSYVAGWASIGARHTEIVVTEPAVKGLRSQPSQRSSRCSPAILAMRSSSAGHA